MVNETHTPEECDFPGCPRPRAAMGLCQPHRQQQVKGQELRPIRLYKKSRISEDWRKCSCCEEVKRVEQFHKRTNSGLQSDCKACMVLTNKVNTRLRAGRLEEALATAEIIPEAKREMYVNKVLDAIKLRDEAN